MHFSKFFFIFICLISLSVSAFGGPEIPDPNTAKLDTSGSHFEPSKKLKESLFNGKAYGSFVGRWIGLMQVHQDGKIVRQYISMNIFTYDNSRFLIQWIDSKDSTLSGTYFSMKASAPSSGALLTFTMKGKKFRMKHSVDGSRAHIDIFSKTSEDLEDMAIGSISLVKKTAPFFFRGEYSVIDAEADLDEVEPIKILVFMDGFNKIQVLPWKDSITESLNSCVDENMNVLEKCSLFSSSAMGISLNSLVAKSKKGSLLYLTLKNKDLMMNPKFFEGIIHHCKEDNEVSGHCDPFKSYLLSFKRLSLQDELEWLENSDYNFFGVPKINSIKILKREDTLEYTTFIGMALGKNIPAQEKYQLLMEGKNKELTLLTLQSTPRWIKFIVRARHEIYNNDVNITFSGVSGGKIILYDGFATKKDLREGQKLGLDPKCYYMGFKKLDVCQNSVKRGFQDVWEYKELHVKSGFKNRFDYTDSVEKDFETSKDYYQALSMGYKDNVEFRKGYLYLGFTKAIDYRDALKRGFEKREDYYDAIKKGFSDSKTYFDSQKKGYKNYSEYKEGFLTNGISKARNFYWVKNLKEKKVLSLSNKEEWVYNLDISHDNENILVLSKEKITVWSLSTGKLVGNIRKSYVGGKWHRAVFSQDKGYILLSFNHKSMGYYTGHLKKINFYNQKSPWTVDTDDRWDFSIFNFSQDHKIIAYNKHFNDYRDTGMIVVAENQEDEKRTNNSFTLYHTVDNKFPLSLVLSPDGKYLFSLHNGNDVYLWDLKTKEKRSLDHNFEVRSIDYSSDGKYLLATGRDGNITMWSVSGKKMYDLLGHKKNTSQGIFYSEGDLFATRSYTDKAVKIWSIKKGKLLREFTFDSYPHDMVFSPNGKYIAVALENKKIIIYSIDD